MMTLPSQLVILLSHSVKGHPQELKKILPYNQVDAALQVLNACLCLGGQKICFTFQILFSPAADTLLFTPMFQQVTIVKLGALA